MPRYGADEDPRVIAEKMSTFHERAMPRRTLEHTDVRRIARAWWFFVTYEQYLGEVSTLHDFLGWSIYELDAYERLHGPLTPRH
jgi:hypothetical protein